MFKNFLPVNDQVLVKLLPKKEHVAGELYVPDNTSSHIEFATVSCAGNSTVVQVGQKVAYAKHNAMILDDVHRLLADKSICGVVHD